MKDHLAFPLSIRRHDRSLPPDKRGKPAGHNGKSGKPVFLYVAYCKGFAKIGISEAPKSRVQNMQGSCPFRIELLTSHPLSQADAIAAEQAAMTSLASDHWFGDWFKCSRNRGLYAAALACKPYEAALVAQKRDMRVLSRRTDPRFPGRVRKVATPDGIFPSATAASKHHGLTRQGVHLRAQKQTHGFSFVDQPT